MPRARKPRRKKAAPASVGLAAAETRLPKSAELARLAERVEADGGAALGSYAEPFGGKALLLAALPIELVEPTPYQREPSDAHVKRLMSVIERVGLFLDPIILIRHEDRYWTPNGNHRLQALRKLGARTIVGLLVTEPEIAFKILALNTEKSHNLKEKSIETIRMARALAAQGGGAESGYELEFEEPAYLTLGVCYEHQPRFAGGAYHPVLRRLEGFLDEALPRALRERERRAGLLLALDEAVSGVVDALKTRGLRSPYLKAFVVARINPIRFSKSTEFDFDEVIPKMTASAKRFNVERVKQEDVVRAAGPPDEAME